MQHSKKVYKSIRSNKDFILTDYAIIRIHSIEQIDLTGIEQQNIRVFAAKSWHQINGFAALELVYQLKPSALEGKRLNWKKHAWAFHNLVGHPLMQILAYFGLYQLAMKIHDGTVPGPIDGPIKIS